MGIRSWSEHFVKNIIVWWSWTWCEYEYEFVMSTITILSLFCLLLIVRKSLLWSWRGRYVFVSVVPSLLLRLRLSVCSSTVTGVTVSSVTRPGILVVWVSAAHVNGVISSPVDTRLEGKKGSEKKTGLNNSYNERDSEHLEVRSQVEHFLRNEAVKVTSRFLDTLHGTWASHEWLAIAPSSAATVRALHKRRSFGSNSPKDRY